MRTENVNAKRSRTHGYTADSPDPISGPAIRRNHDMHRVLGANSPLPSNCHFVTRAHSSHTTFVTFFKAQRIVIERLYPIDGGHSTRFRGGERGRQLELRLSPLVLNIGGRLWLQEWWSFRHHVSPRTSSLRRAWDLQRGPAGVCILLCS